jgi:hypothetical protein
MTEAPKKKCSYCFGKGMVFGKNCPKCNKLNMTMPIDRSAFNARWEATNGPAKPQ